MDYDATAKQICDDAWKTRSVTAGQYAALEDVIDKIVDYDTWHLAMSTQIAIVANGIKVVD